MESDSPSKSLQFFAHSVDCSEAIDWELVRVTFDTEMPDFDEDHRTTPFVSLSANFEFGNDIQVEVYDGEDYHGSGLKAINLWRDQTMLFTTCGRKFNIQFKLEDDAFRELNQYLEVLLRSDLSPQQSPAEDAP